MPERLFVCVVGGINADISGTPHEALLPHDSNPGRVKVTPGGVGRNIAENLVRLGVSTALVTVTGDDANGAWLRTSCDAIGIDLSGAATLTSVPTGTYLCLNQRDGDILAAISDMQACDAITPDFVAARMQLLNRADAVVVDANLPADTVRYLAAHCRAPLAADPVSVRKAGRLGSLLHRLCLIKPNLREAAALTGEAQAQDAARVLLEAGVGRAMITLGEKGVWFADAKDRGLMPCAAGPVVNTNGCGDAFFSASLRATLEGADVRESARLGQAAAAICAACESAVNPALTWSMVRQTAKI